MVRTLLRLALGALLIGAALLPASPTYRPVVDSDFVPGAKCISPSRIDPVHPATELAREIAGIKFASDLERDSYFAEHFCMVRLRSVDDFSPVASVSSDVTMYKPTLYFNTQGRYYTTGSEAKWTYINRLMNERSSGAVGKYDGWGLAANVSLNVYDWTMTWEGMNTKCYPFSYSYSAAEANSYGVGYERQDYATTCGGWDYNHYVNVVYMDFWGTASGRCYNVQIFGKMAHTWSSTGVNGISIGVNSIGISFSSSSNRWTRASYPSAAYTICGSGSG